MTSTSLSVVRHSGVLPVNQLVDAGLARRDRQVNLVLPDRWGLDCGEITPTPLPALADGLNPSPVVLTGGAALAIEALAECRADGAGIVLRVVGPGNEVRFVAMSAELGVGDAVSFFGRRSVTERFDGAADFFVITSSCATFSLALLEAAAAGLPLIFPDITGVADLVGGGAAGIVVERNADSVAAALLAMANLGSRTRLSEEARRREKHDTWARSAPTAVDLYRSLPQEAS